MTNIAISTDIMKNETGTLIRLSFQGSIIETKQLCDLAQYTFLT